MRVTLRRDVAIFIRAIFTLESILKQELRIAKNERYEAHLHPLSQSMQLRPSLIQGIVPARRL